MRDWEDFVSNIYIYIYRERERGKVERKSN